MHSHLCTCRDTHTHTHTHECTRARTYNCTLSHTRKQARESEPHKPELVGVTLDGIQASAHACTHTCVCICAHTYTRVCGQGASRSCSGVRGCRTAGTTSWCTRCSRARSIRSGRSMPSPSLVAAGHHCRYHLTHATIHVYAQRITTECSACMHMCVLSQLTPVVGAALLPSPSDPTLLSLQLPKLRADRWYARKHAYTHTRTHT